LLFAVLMFARLFPYLEKYYLLLNVFFAVFRYYLHVVKENAVETSLKPWQGNIALVFERSTSAFE